MRRSRRVFVIDCKSHQWRKLPKMLLCRKEADVNVIDGKIYVTAGCSSRYYNTGNYGEVYDLKTQTWYTWEPTTQQVLTDEQYAIRYLNDQEVPTRYLTDEQYSMSYLNNERVNKQYLTGSFQPINYSSIKCYVATYAFEVYKENNRLWLTAMVHKGELLCGYWKQFYRVLGLEAISSNYLISVANPGRENRVTVWWKTYTECETQVWCAEISIVFVFNNIIRGFIEWSENVFTFQGCQSHDDSELLLHSALVTHNH